MTTTAPAVTTTASVSTTKPVTTTTVTTTAAVTTSGVKPPVVVTNYGDTNLDGTVDVSDVVLACRFIVGDVSAVIKDAGVASSDVDDDGQVTTNDTTLMLKKIAKQITKFPAEEKNA